MNRPSSHSESRLEKSARTMRHAHKAGEKSESGSEAVDAQNEINQPDNAKGRPAPSGQSNAGRDGGA